MDTKKLIQAPLDEENVVTDFIECDIFCDGCTHKQVRSRHTYLGFYQGHALLVEYSQDSNTLFCKFVDDEHAGMTQRLEEYMAQMNYDENSNILVLSQRSLSVVNFSF